MTRAEKYEADRLIEAGVAQFLDANFYPRLNRPTTRWTDREHQFAGVDVTVGQIRFDEKLKVRGCLNEVYGSPGFEMSMVNRAGLVQAGWFASPLSTDYYTIIGVSAYNAGGYSPKDYETAPHYENAISDANEIKACDVLWVKKSELVRFVERRAGMEALKRDADELRAGRAGKAVKKGMARLFYDHRDFWLTYSARLDEKPVNLVVPRKLLEQLPGSARFEATRKGVRRIRA